MCHVVSLICSGWSGLRLFGFSWGLSPACCHCLEQPWWQVREPSSKKEKEKTWARCRTWSLVSSLIKFGDSVGMSSSYQQLNHHKLLSHDESILDLGPTGSWLSHNSQIVRVYPHCPSQCLDVPWSFEASLWTRLHTHRSECILEHLKIFRRKLKPHPPMRSLVISWFRWFMVSWPKPKKVLTCHDNMSRRVTYDVMLVVVGSFHRFHSVRRERSSQIEQLVEPGLRKRRNWISQLSGLKSWKPSNRAGASWRISA